jgi:hypothetical protein
MDMSILIVAIPSTLAFLGVAFQSIINYRKDAKNLVFQKAQLDYQKQQAAKDAELKQEIADRADVQDKKLEAKFDLIVEKNLELQQQFYTLNQTVLGIITTTNAEKFMDSGIYNATKGEVINLIKNNFTINTDIKSVLNYWGSLMFKLAESFYDSESRKNKADKFKRAEELSQQRILILSDFNTFVNSKIRDVKTTSSRTRIEFSDWLDKTNTYSSFEILLNELEINGLSNEEYVKKFEIQVKKFCKALLQSLKDWERLESKTLFDKEVA